ncbi:MAG: ketol-acid reductoisomerase [bacterium]|nr:MAG: ketol-acid reductoisomerase [bacterium]
MNIYTDKDVDQSILEGRRIVVVGYGNQGRPQSMNLRDSGFDVSVAVRGGGAGSERAAADGFTVLDIGAAAREADVLLLLVPDEVHGSLFETEIAANLRPGATLCFAHGFSVAFGEIESSDYDLVLVAPKGQGQRLRDSYCEGSGLPCLVAVERDVSGRALEIALAIAGGLGCLRVGAFETTFREEAVSDLFGEQAVLCGGVPALIKCAFDILVRRGFSPEVAYFECFHELKIIVDLFADLGFSGMRDLISGTAAYGSLRYGEDVIAGNVTEEMEKLFTRIESGEFAERWLHQSRAASQELERLREAERNSLIEEVGDRVRRMFPPRRQ